jgi:hypothetical protein
MATIYELAKDVDRAQQELDRAKQRLLGAINGAGLVTTRTPRRNGQARRGPGSDSVAARVFALVQGAGPNGIARADIIARFPGSEPAAESALKKYSSQKRLESVDGRWRVVTTPLPRGKASK